MVDKIYHQNLSMCSNSNGTSSSFNNGMEGKLVKLYIQDPWGVCVPIKKLFSIKNRPKWHKNKAFLMWLIWRECKTRIFEDIERPVDLLRSMLVETLFKWSRIWGYTQCISIPDFLMSFSFSLWFVCICYKYHEFNIVNTTHHEHIASFLFVNKLWLSIKI